MTFSDKDIIKLAKEISEFKEIPPIEIPYIDLYMDQITTLFEDKLSHFKRKDEEMILTKTMINNYAKAKILPPIKNKKYSKTQVMLLILIYNLKQTLSLEDIKLLIEPAITPSTEASVIDEKVSELYDNFLKLKENQIEPFLENVTNDINTIEAMYKDSNLEDSPHNLILTVLALINSANLQKRLAEKIIDSYFKIPDKK
jgi:DNA-binding transcriptional MerR regulator